MNSWTITGNLGSDAVVKQAGASTVAEISIGVESGYGQHKTTIWVRGKLWGKKAEGGLIPYLVKGQRISATGEMSVREWTKDTGEKNYSVELNIDRIGLEGRAKSGDSGSSQYEPPPMDEDVPF
jgi:single-stranded DNA-binding protein